MTPVAVDTASSLPAAPISPKGPALVIGSLNTASSGSYQNLITTLQETRSVVDKLLLDRIVDKATYLEPSKYASIHVVLTASDWDTVDLNLEYVLKEIKEGLSSLGTLHIVSPPSSTHEHLKKVGLEVLSDSGDLVAQNPSNPPATSAPTKSLLLPKRKANPNKRALWTITSPSTPTIDSESLLTAKDLERPIPTCEPFDPNAPRKKRACKGCTCGLADFETTLMVAPGIDGEVVEVNRSERDRLIQAAKEAPKASSSCGSCFLGDAFRCAGCPYMGLPAFKPGEKVEIDFGMDDI